MKHKRLQGDAWQEINKTSKASHDDQNANIKVSKQKQWRCECRGKETKHKLIWAMHMHKIQHET
jgi:hypothetical protein